VNKAKPSVTHSCEDKSFNSQEDPFRRDKSQKTTELAQKQGSTCGHCDEEDETSS